MVVVVSKLWGAGIIRSCRFCIFFSFPDAYIHTDECERARVCDTIFFKYLTSFTINIYRLFQIEKSLKLDASSNKQQANEQQNNTKYIKSFEFFWN